MKVKFNGNFLQIHDVNTWEYCVRKTKSGHVVNISAFTPKHEIILIEQFRQALNKWVIECPAGIIGDENSSETALECAKKELLEESGFVSNKWMKIYESPSSAGLTNEVVHKFLALNCIQKSKGGGTETEQIKNHIIDYDKIHSFLEQKQEQGCLIESSIYTGMYFFEQIKIDFKNNKI